MAAPTAIAAPSMSELFASIASANAPPMQQLRHVSESQQRDCSAPSVVRITQEEHAAAVAEETERREYFFNTGVDSWYTSEVADATFRSAFVELKPEEARTIVQHWVRDHYEQRIQNEGKCDDNNADINDSAAESSLSDLSERIDKCIRSEFAATGAFVKLSTRSPKDSKSAFALATQLWSEACSDSDESDNEKLIRLMNCSARSLKVDSGSEALERLLDSERVWEDLVFALEDVANWNVCITVREFNPGVTIDTEFRGFVWNGQLTGITQYAHALHFPALLAPHIRENIAADCREFFERIKDKIPLENYIIDFCWLGGNCPPGDNDGNSRVFLVEVNPFDGVLGSFPCSTGLFSWEDDRQVMMNGPFELRLREEVALPEELKHQMSVPWRKLIYGF